MATPWDKMILYTALLVSFTRQIVNSEEKIHLPVTIGVTTHMVELFIVSAPSPYNCILGSPALDQLQAKVSTNNQAIKIPIGEEVQTNYRDKKSSTRILFCYHKGGRK